MIFIGWGLQFGVGLCLAILIADAIEHSIKHLLNIYKKKKGLKEKPITELYCPIRQRGGQDVFVPFQKVLVRDENSVWKIDIFESYKESRAYPYICLSDAWKECIAYNEFTKHLLNTKEDWEKEV